MADKVPSPMWLALSALHIDVQQHVGLVGGALKDADKRMAGGKGDVWVGSAARTWGNDLAGTSNDISRQAADFASYVHRELASQPKEVTQTEADTERRLLAGRLP